MGLQNYLAPFVGQGSTGTEPSSHVEKAMTMDIDTISAIAKVFRTVSMALGASNMSFTGRKTFEAAPYDFDSLIKAIDTDSFVRQSFFKYKELIWKEGWNIVSENESAVDYLHERIGYMEMAMSSAFDDFLVEVGDQLVKFHNVFIAKSRNEDLKRFFPGRIYSDRPIVGYYVVPAETMEVKRDKFNRPLRYRQRIDDRLQGFGSRSRDSAPSWAPEDMIHISFDKKPGRIFGTPFLVSVIEDIVALRQMEEDIQNLVHKELFPLYKYKVGTPEHPAEPREIDEAAAELANLRTDGGLVLPDRHDVDVIGSQNNALEASSYLRHFVNRVCTGMGLSPHHLGIMDEAGNRAIADRLDIALYDKVKTYQRHIANAIRIKIFNELLLEGRFDPIIHPDATGESDRCEFKFAEIDVDTQVKKENHIIQKWTNNIATSQEVRYELGYDPDMDEQDTLVALNRRIDPPNTPGSSGSETNKPDAQKPSSGGRKNRKNTTKSTGNKSRPSNQHGRRSSPNIRHSYNEENLKSIIELIDDQEEDIQGV